MASKNKDFHDGPSLDHSIPPGYERDQHGEIIAIPESHVRFDGHFSDVSLDERPDLWSRFFETYARTGRLTAACAAVGCSRNTALRTARSNKSFADLLASAHDVYRGAIHAEIQRRGVDGVTKPIYYKGELVGTTQEYSDRFLEIEARRVDPEFREILQPPKTNGQTTVNVNAVATATSATALATAPQDAGSGLRRLDARTMTRAERDAMRVLLRAQRALQAGEPGVGSTEPGGGAAGVLDVDAREVDDAIQEAGEAPEASNLPSDGSEG